MSEDMAISNGTALLDNTAVLHQDIHEWLGTEKNQNK